MEFIKKYFSDLDSIQIEQFAQLNDLYSYWNSKINVISRKDIADLNTHHILHSLAIAKAIQFKPKTRIMDVGTGGGFPGIPLAILFPNCKFYLIDSIGKKIKVVDEIKKALCLKNVKTQQIRVQRVSRKFDFVISRAVTAFPGFVSIVRKNVLLKSKNVLPNGILYLKGGNFQNEIVGYSDKITLFNCSDFFEEDFFETKKVIHLAI